MSGAYVRGFWTQVPVSDDFAIRSYVRGFWTHCPWVTDGILFFDGAQPYCPALVDPLRRIEQHTIPIHEIAIIQNECHVVNTISNTATIESEACMKRAFLR